MPKTSLKIDRTSAEQYAIAMMKDLTLYDTAREVWDCNAEAHRGKHVEILAKMYVDMNDLVRGWERMRKEHFEKHHPFALSVVEATHKRPT
jgi:hypothetical protein